MVNEPTGSGKLIMCRGLPASGKTTWSMSQVRNGNGVVKRINKDDLRNMIDSSKHSNQRESEIIYIRNFAIEYWLDKGYTVIVDDTNFSPKHELVLSGLARQYNAEFHIEDFTEVGVSECLKRNAGRDNKVPEKVILDMWKQYIYEEPRTWGLDGIVICDLDGTYCLLNGRSPYDASTCINDEVNMLVADLLDKYFTDPDVKKIYFFTGRHDTHRAQTIEWLDINTRYSNWELVMRKEGDNRPDEIVKREMYDEHIKNKYHVWAWIDDRPKVLNMVRFDLCLPTIDVGWGIHF